MLIISRCISRYQSRTESLSLFWFVHKTRNFVNDVKVKPSKVLWLHEWHAKVWPRPRCCQLYIIQQPWRRWAVICHVFLFNFSKKLLVVIVNALKVIMKLLKKTAFVLTILCRLMYPLSLSSSLSLSLSLSLFLSHNIYLLLSSVALVVLHCTYHNTPHAVIIHCSHHLLSNVAPYPVIRTAQIILHFASWQICLVKHRLDFYQKNSATL